MTIFYFLPTKAESFKPKSMKFRPEAEPRKASSFKISWKFQPKKKISAIIAYKQTTDKKATDRSPSTVDGYLVMATKKG